MNIDPLAPIFTQETLDALRSRTWRPLSGALDADGFPLGSFAPAGENLATSLDKLQSKIDEFALSMDGINRSEAFSTGS